MPSELAGPPTPRSPQEALALMERSHAATIALLPEDDDAGDETRPLSRAWFEGVREACARTGRVPGVDRMLFEWWINEPPIEGLTQLPWLFGVWQGHWICWAGTQPWAAADLAASSTFDAAAVAVGVQFGADPSHPPASPWPPFGTSALAVPTVILLALSGQPAPADHIIPATPPYVAPPAPVAPPPPPPPPVAAPVAAEPVARPEPPGAPGALPPEGAASLLPSASPAPTEAPPEPEPEPEAIPADEPDLDVTQALVAEDAPATAVQPAIEAPDASPEPIAPAPAAVAPMAPIEPPPAQNLPPAGWHPDPSGRHALRYWDGTGWTAHAADPGSDTIHDPI